MAAKNPYKKGTGESFASKFQPDQVAFFNKCSKLPFGEQGAAFLNAFWPKVKEQAEFIFTVYYDWIRKADMHFKGISLVHKYSEGCEMNFDNILYFYEQLCKFCDENPKKMDLVPYKKSMPEMMTALKRKTELDTIDVNDDNQISFLEVLLHQFREFASAEVFIANSMSQEEHPLIIAARNALNDVNEKIRAYEEEKERLETESQGSGVKALAAKNSLAQIESGPLKEQLNKSLIDAEAAVRKAVKKYGGEKGESGPTAGTIWWMERELREKNEKYGPRKKA